MNIEPCEKAFTMFSFVAAKENYPVVDQSTYLGEAISLWLQLTAAPLITEI